jgi:hypothetical protein
VGEVNSEPGRFVVHTLRECVGSVRRRFLRYFNLTYLALASFKMGVSGSEKSFAVTS